MLKNPLTYAAPWAFDRLTLALNHVLSSEPVACAKLKPHSGQRLSVQWVPAPGVRPPEWVGRLLSLRDGLPPALNWSITPAGLLEWHDQPHPDGVAPSLTLTVTLDHPWQMAWQAMRGQRPDVKIEGDAQMAEVAAWLMKNLRWDLEDDLARALGAAPTELLRRTAESAREALGRGWDNLQSRRPGATTGSTDR